MNVPIPTGQLLGITLKVASTIAFVGMATLVKLLSDRYPTGEVTFARSFFALFPVLVWVAWREQLRDAFRTNHFGRHMVRAGFGTAAMFCGFTALAVLPFADATAIGYAAPLLTVVFATFLLGEKVHVYRWSAVIVGMAGVLVILSSHVGAESSQESNMFGAVIALVGAVFAAIAATQARILVRSDSPNTVVAYFSLFVAVVSLATMPFGWVVPTFGDAVLMVTMGVLGGVGQVLLTTSYRFGDASTIAPFDYVSMVWALIVSLLVFGTWPSLTVLAGAVIVIGAGLFVIYREHRLGIERARSKQAQTPTTPIT